MNQKLKTTQEALGIKIFHGSYDAEIVNPANEFLAKLGIENIHDIKIHNIGNEIVILVIYRYTDEN